MLPKLLIEKQIEGNLEALKQISVITDNQADELRQMNAYLLGELERQRLEDEATEEPCP